MRSMQFKITENGITPFASRRFAYNSGPDLLLCENMSDEWEVVETMKMNDINKTYATNWATETDNYSFVKCHPMQYNSIMNEFVNSLHSLIQGRPVVFANDDSSIEFREFLDCICSVCSSADLSKRIEAGKRYEHDDEIFVAGEDGGVQ